jgi:hypothetical protein
LRREAQSIFFSFTLIDWVFGSPPVRAGGSWVQEARLQGAFLRSISSASFRLPCSGQLLTNVATIFSWAASVVPSDVQRTTTSFGTGPRWR